MNKYEKWYYNIIDRAKLRKLTGYKERHHIVPWCLGGSNASENMAELTGREHFICHWLLTKMYTGEARSKMINALYMMNAHSTYQERYTSRITSRVYDNLREDYAKYISNLNKGRKKPIEEIIRQQESYQRNKLLGKERKPVSDEVRAKRSEASKGSRNSMFGRKHSDKAKALIGQVAKGRKQSPEVIARRSATMKAMNMKRERKICPHCSRSIAVNTYAMWHGDKCKLKETVIA